MAMFHSMHAMGIHSLDRGTNKLDGGAHFYDTYETRDGKYISIGSIEPQFYAQLLDVAGLSEDLFRDQLNKENWPELKQAVAEAFAQKTRDEWCELMEGTDICFAPVLDLEEAASHPHNVTRKTYIRVGEMVQPAPAPRFSRTVSGTPSPAKPYGADTEAVFTELGYDSEKLSAL